MTDRELMIEYLNLRVRMQDWHGVRDAAADLEVIDAQTSAIAARGGAVTWVDKIPGKPDAK